MKNLEIVAHRGVPQDAPENTIRSFHRAVELGADVIELDVRLTLDRVPVVYHYFNLEVMTNGSGGIFTHTLDQLKHLEVNGIGNKPGEIDRIPTLQEILEIFAGKIRLEIHIQGPEPEAAQIIGDVLKQYSNLWEQIEVTSYDPAMLLAVQEQCSGLIADLLMPVSENWMTAEIIGYQALHRSRLSKARAVHLHHTQLSDEAISLLHDHGFRIHSWDVNDKQAFETVTGYGITRFCTDEVEKIQEYLNTLDPQY